MERKNDLLDRTFNFALACIKFSRQLPKAEEYRIIKNQLLRSATSVGANYEESQGGSSKPDFRNKVRISLNEARESNYWLRLIKGLNDIQSVDLDILIKESDELKRILATILNNSS